MSQDKPQNRPGRRRRLLLVGLVGLVITIFVLIPGYIASKPKFLQRFDAFGGPYESWATSVHAQVECKDCHTSPGRGAQIGYNARMLTEFYLSLVLPSRQPNVLRSPTDAACQSCHIDLRTVSPSGDLNIPHRAHVTILKMRCIECHDTLVHKTNAQGNHTPSMARCLTCHDGDKAKDECSACHTDKAPPEDHKAQGWLVIHSQEQKKADCTKCHKWTADWCVQCHSSRPQSHTKLWRTEHREQVKKHRNCEACHEAAFCVRCHGEVPRQNFNPALAVVR